MIIIPIEILSAILLSEAVTTTTMTTAASANQAAAIITTTTIVTHAIGRITRAINRFSSMFATTIPAGINTIVAGAATTIIRITEISTIDVTVASVAF